MQFRAKIEATGGLSAAWTKLDRYREVQLPGTEHGMTLSNLAATGEPDVYDVDVEIDADDAAEAREIFERVRASTNPNEYGLTLYGLEAVEPAPGMGR